MAARTQSDGPTAGTPWTGSAGIRETTAEIMAREAAFGPRIGGPEEALPVRVPPNRLSNPQNPESPELPQWPPQNKSTQALVPLSPQTLGTNFTGATLADTSAFPPDSMGAAGPTQFLVGVNGRIRTFNKATGAADGALNATMNTFFNSVRNGFGTSDPRVRFDRLSGRWFVIIINVSVPNRVLIAVSDSGAISSGTVWTFFFFDQHLVSPPGDASCLSDYPTLGIDANALYIGVNQFCSPPPSLAFNGTAAFVVRKSSVLVPGPIVVSAFRNLTGTPTGPGPYTPQGVDNYDPSATQGYFIGVDNQTFGTLMVRRVSNPGGVPTLSGNISLTVPSTRFPITVRHLGNTGGSNGFLDALDDRLFDAHIRNGRLWTAHNIGVNNTGVASSSATRNASRWYELQNLNATPSLVQAGTLFTATPDNTFDARNYWIPSVMVSGQGHMALGCSIAGTNEFANAATVGRLAGDPLGTLQTPVAYTASSTAYNPPADDGSVRGARRWGDYSYTSLDPCDDMTMWTIQEFCDATNSYGVRVVQLIAPPPATPSTASPPSVSQGQSSVNVAITGTPSSGSGFYDPGAGFACRIGASVSGSVTVNSVTYSSPTAVTLNISTVGASAGPQTVTVTNPDGQSRSSASAILCTAPSPPTASNNGPICASQTLQLTASTVLGATYSWTGPNGFTSSQQNPTIPNATTAASGTYSVTATVSGCASAPATTPTVVNAVPSATISAPSSVCPNSVGYIASVPDAGPGATYTWAITNGTITAGQGTRTITFSAGSTGSVSLNVTVQNGAGCSASGSRSVSIDPACGGYFTVTPCRVADTRDPAGPFGGPALAANSVRTFPIAGRCVIPATAKVVSLNITVTEPTALGHLTVSPAGAPIPFTSSINYRAGQTRANNVIVRLGAAGDLAVQCVQPSGTVHFIIDANGYFE